MITEANLVAEISTAMQDYYKYVDESHMHYYDLFTENAYRVVAKTALEKKAHLRSIFRKIPGWDESRQCVKIEMCVGNTEYKKEVDKALSDIVYLTPPCLVTLSYDKIELIFWLIDYIVNGTVSQYLKELFPDTFHKGRKITRCLMEVFKKIGVSEHSDFDSVFNNLVGVIKNKTLHKEVYISINPGHIMTMSNPKGDTRGEMLTSCQSLNNVSFVHSGGCTGYVNDEVSFIVFTCAKGGEFNRKTLRMMFHYYNGYFLQNRIYTSIGGRSIQTIESKIIGQKVADIISKVAGHKAKVGEENEVFKVNDLFGGFNDWDEGFPYIVYGDPKDKEAYIGGPGICLCCGKELKDYALCNECYALYVVKHN